jgi:choline dehydrogenase
LAGLQELGAPRGQDLNAQAGEGVGYAVRNIWRGRRQSAATAFPRPAAGRRNLSIATGTTIDKISFADGRATGVVGQDAQGPASFEARRGVILTAGAINTPKLLQLSRIGPARLLTKTGVKVVVDSPGVGQNLSDHRCFFPKFRVNGGSENREFRGWRLYRNVLRQTLLAMAP